ncbi:MAG: Arm DNA-binding domain-containing protein, partial [Puia sp.]
MNVKQKFSILFYLKRSKTSKDGRIPIYVRITIDGLKEEFSLGCKVLSRHWDKKTKTVLARDPDFKAINKKIGQVKVDIE